MAQKSVAEALLVHLVVEDHPNLKEGKYAQRCREARDAFRALFEIKERRALLNAGPIAANDASILMRGEGDMAATEAWAAEYKRIILRAARVEDVELPFAEEVKKRERKPPKPDAIASVPAVAEDDEEDGVVHARVGALPDDED